MNSASAKALRSSDDPPARDFAPESDDAIFDMMELFFFAYRDFVKDADRLLEKYKFGRAHHRVLHFVDRRPGLAIAALLDILKITKQSLNRVLKQLLDGGFVEAREGANDRRQRLLYTSSQGRGAGAGAGPPAVGPLRARTERTFPRRATLGDGIPAGDDRPRRARQRRGVSPRRGDDAPGRRRGAAVTQLALLEAEAPHILVVDDDKRIRALLSRFLIGEGYRVSAAASAAEATARLRDLLFDLIVLDVMMPGESGVQFAARLRDGASPLRDAPILMLTALSETKNRVEGLEAGVDDYLAKPFEPRELALRIACILRRTRGRDASRRPVGFGDFRFDVEKGLLTRGDQPIHLTTRERELLRLLAGGAVVSRRTLAPRAGADAEANERSVDVEIARLRRKIDGGAHCLQTVRGQGYRLIVDGEGHNTFEHGAPP